MVIVFVVLGVVADRALYVRRSPFHFKYMPLRMVPSTCELSKPTRTTAAVLQFVSDQTKLANLIATPSASLDRLLHELMKEDRANLEALQWVSLSTEQSRSLHGWELSGVNVTELHRTSSIGLTMQSSRCFYISHH